MGLVFTTKLICLGIQEKFTIKQVTQVLQSSKKDLSMRSVSMFPKLKKIVAQHVAAHSPQLSSPPLSPRFATFHLGSPPFTSVRHCIESIVPTHSVWRWKDNRRKIPNFLKLSLQQSNPRADNLEWHVGCHILHWPLAWQQQSNMTTQLVITATWLMYLFPLMARGAST